MPILPSHARFEGEGIPKLTQEWWSWAVDQPVGKNAFEDTTGDYAYLGAEQGNAGHVFFLAGIAGNTDATDNSLTATRIFKVPAGEMLFVPVANWTSDYDLPTAKDRIESLEATRDLLTHVSATIDGHTVADLSPDSDTYYVTTGDFTLGPAEVGTVGSAPFAFAMPTDHEIVVRAAGFYLPIVGLGVGSHTINIQAGFDWGGGPNDEPDGIDDFSFNITDEITIVPRSQYYAQDSHDFAFA